MKKIFTVLFSAVAALSAAAQSLPDNGGFKRENVFVGGGIGLGIGGWSGGLNVGATPELGYSLANWVDVGLAGNFNYYSYRAEVNNGIRQRSTTLGTGVFTRLHPIRNFFLQAQPEYNWMTTNLKDQRPGGGGSVYKVKQEAGSLLLGVGYGTRVVGQSSFYTMILFDVADNPNSPYIDSYGSRLPILRTGFNIYLRPKRER